MACCPTSISGILTKPTYKYDHATHSSNVEFNFDLELEQKRVDNCNYGLNVDCAIIKCGPNRQLVHRYMCR